MQAPGFQNVNLMKRNFLHNLNLVSELAPLQRGEGYHNVAGHIDHANYKSESYFDAHLTPLGWDQCAALKAHLAAAPKGQHLLDRVELVVVSPLMRALETAVGSLGGATPAPSGEPVLMASQSPLEGVRPGHDAVSGAGLPSFVACELCREHLGLHPCDRRRTISEYKEMFPGVDFSLIENDEDVLWEKDVRESDDGIRRRGGEFLEWLMVGLLHNATAG